MQGARYRLKPLLSLLLQVARMGRQGAAYYRTLRLATLAIDARNTSDSSLVAEQLPRKPEENMMTLSSLQVQNCIEWDLPTPRQMQTSRWPDRMLALSGRRGRLLSLCAADIPQRLLAGLEALSGLDVQGKP